MSNSPNKTALIIGAGPGLGMSIAHRFGREGYRIALVSRSAARHAAYNSALAEAGIESDAFVADVGEHDQLAAALDAATERFGPVDTVYYGPGAAALGKRPEPIAETGTAHVREAMGIVYPAVDLVQLVLPGMIERGGGSLLFAGGLSAVMPMPPLGGLAVASAALRNYVLTLNAGVAEHGVYAGSLVIGGLIERGDIYRYATSHPEVFGDVGNMTLDPDTIAAGAWDLHSKRDRPEATFSAFG